MAQMLRTAPTLYNEEDKYTDEMNRTKSKPIYVRPQGCTATKDGKRLEM